MAKLSKEQKAAIEKKLSLPWNSVKFRIDGYDVVASVERYKGLRYTIVVYVNGSWKGEWMKPGHELQKRFYRISSQCVMSAKEQAEYIKIFGRSKAVKERAVRKIELAYPNWNSVKAMLRHFEQNNESIEYLPDLDQQAVAS